LHIIFKGTQGTVQKQVKSSTRLLVLNPLPDSRGKGTMIPQIQLFNARTKITLNINIPIS